MQWCGGAENSDWVVFDTLQRCERLLRVKGSGEVYPTLCQLCLLDKELVLSCLFYYIIQKGCSL